MYQEFFSLRIKPFSISPDPSFLFLSERHKEAIAHLRHGLKGHGGFVLLTGEVGTGKTTTCRSLLEEMGDNTDIAFILNPALTEIELLSTICDAFKIEYQDKNLRTLFNELSLWVIKNHQRNQHTVVLIDEAQHLSFSALEQLRLLTHIESNGKKLLQVILIGQTELQDKLKKDEFRPLAQRITARYHLLPMTQQEGSHYIQHRLNIAGSIHAIFEKSALQEIFKRCQGVPRLTNILCDRSLLAAYTQDSHIVTKKMVKIASEEVHFSTKKPSLGFFKHHWRMITLALLAIFTVAQAPQLATQFGLAPLVDNLTAQVKLIANEVREAEKPPHLITSTNWFDDYQHLNLLQTGYNASLADLFAVWGYEVGNTVTCDQGLSALLVCYSRKTTLDKLKKLNYPAVVRLQGDNPQQVHAVLYKMADTYQLIINGNLIHVTQAWFERHWSGDATLLWKAPFTLKGPIQFGDEGKEITWINNQLNKEQGWPSEHKVRFDLRLLDQVSAYQREQGLMDDGIVGPRTLMHLMQLVDTNSPRLLQEAN